MIVWLRKTPSNVAPMPGQRVARALVAGVGLELDPVRAERLEGVGQLEQLGLAVGAGPLERASPIHVQPISSRLCSGTIDM